MTPNTPGDPVQHNSHNPDGLSDAQVGITDGWRLLDEDEVIPITSIPPIDGLENWVHERWDRGGAPPKTWRGNGHSCTYRTRLTRDELRAARGLPPISETGEEKPLFKSDDEMLISLTGSAKEVVLKNPDGSTWTPAAPAPAGDDTCHLITQYLGNGGLFNPEMMDHDRVRDLLMKCRDELSASRREVAEIARERDAAVNWAAKLSKQLIKTDEGLGTATEQLHTANRVNDFLRAQLKYIADEISTQLGATAEQLQAAVVERDLLRAGFENMRGARHEAQDRTLAAEAACVVMREALGRTAKDRQFGPCWCDTVSGLYCVGQPQCKSATKALATDAGQSLLDELEKAKKDVARLDWLTDCRNQEKLHGGFNTRLPYPIREAIDAAIAQKEAL